MVKLMDKTIDNDKKSPRCISHRGLQEFNFNL